MMVKAWLPWNSPYKDDWNFDDELLLPARPGEITILEAVDLARAMDCVVTKYMVRWAIKNFIIPAAKRRVAGNSSWHMPRPEVVAWLAARCGGAE